MYNFTKKLLKEFLDLVGIEIHQKRQIIAQPPRVSMHGCLNQALQNGLRPQTIIDVGAASGTPALYEVFPEARQILIEPLEEFVPKLDLLVSKLHRAEYIIAAAGTKQGSIVLNVHPDLVGSSIYKEGEVSNVNGVERTVPMVTLDRVCQDRDAEPPYLIKIDTQGAELDVLKGAERVLQETEFIILEVSLFEFFQGGSQLFDCINFMKERHFIAYDLFNLQYRLLDGAVSQVDIDFVKEESHFREFHFYATREQRSWQNQRLLESLNK